jgi:large subunit ribosomal protein L21e
MKRSKGYFSKHLKSLKFDRKPTIADLIKNFEIGQKVKILPLPYYKQGQIPHRRYTNLVGTIIEKRGRSYVVEVFLGEKRKTLIVGPVHLQSISK